MGGVSRSQIRPDTEGAIIEGMASLENKCGFASARSSSAVDRYIASFEIKVRVWTLAPSKQRGFRPSFRGRAIAANEVTLSEVKEIGLLIASKNT